MKILLIHVDRVLMFGVRLRTFFGEHKLAIILFIIYLYFIYYLFYYFRYYQKGQLSEAVEIAASSLWVCLCLCATVIYLAKRL